MVFFVGRLKAVNSQGGFFGQHHSEPVLQEIFRPLIKEQQNSVLIEKSFINHV